MEWRRRLFPLAVAALLAGCAVPHHDTVMRGNADGVIINYYGDVAETEPLSRQYCAQYERVPVLRQTKEENVYYACVRASGPPGAGS